MNLTTASCGHEIYAVGSPNSPVRLADEGSPCYWCRQDAEIYPCCPVCGRADLYRGVNMSFCIEEHGYQADTSHVPQAVA